MIRCWYCADKEDLCLCKQSLDWCHECNDWKMFCEGCSNYKRKEPEECV